MTTLPQFVKTVEADVVKWVGEAETFVAKEAHEAWGLIHPILLAFEPKALMSLTAAIIALLEKVGPNLTIDDVLNALETEANDLFQLAQQAGSDILAAVISLAKASVPKG